VSGFFNCQNFLSKQYKEKQNNIPILNSRDKQNREMQEKIAQIIHQVIVTQMTEKLTNSLCSELQRSLLPTISTRLDAIKMQIHRDISDKFATNEVAIKESLFKICNNEVSVLAYVQKVYL
jgi:hypothetical protein